jgi:hypothetical protein
MIVVRLFVEQCEIYIERKDNRGHDANAAAESKMFIAFVVEA